MSFLKPSWFSPELPTGPLPHFIPFPTSKALSTSSPALLIHTFGFQPSSRHSALSTVAQALRMTVASRLLWPLCSGLEIPKRGLTFGTTTSRVQTLQFLGRVSRTHIHAVAFTPSVCQSALLSTCRTCSNKWLTGMSTPQVSFFRSLHSLSTLRVYQIYHAHDFLDTRPVDKLTHTKSYTAALKCAADADAWCLALWLTQEMQQKGDCDWTRRTRRTRRTRIGSGSARPCLESNFPKYTATST